MRLNFLTVLKVACFLVNGFCASAQNLSSTYTNDQGVIKTGQDIFQLKCATCHNFRQQGIGPSLSGVTAKRSGEWLTKFIQNSQALIKRGDKQAVALFKRYNVPMPANEDLTKPEMRALLSYINTYGAGKGDRSVKDLTTTRPGLPVTDPVKSKISNSGLKLYLQEVHTAPVTADKAPKARINDMFVLKGKTERWFIQEMRGRLYEIKDSGLVTVFDISNEMPRFVSSPGLGSGFGSYTFHPEFYNNGLFYTTHTEKPGVKVADFTFSDSIRVAIQWVITEWKLDDPGSAKFSGTPREIFRIDMPAEMHGMQQITFNPLAKPDSSDYGLLYIGIGDGGSTESGYPWLCSTTESLRSSVIRIDPAGRNSANKKYGIPGINPFANDGNPKTAGEIFARGFRNPNRLTWAPDGKMLVADIGQTNIEEVNIVVAGGDYGWPHREGTFVMNYKGKMNLVYALPIGSSKYLSPVLQYDHDEGNAISAGFVYTGSVAALKNKYVFGDIVKGRVFVADYSTFKQGNQSKIRELSLNFNGEPGTFVQVTGSAKADLRFGVGIDHELYLYTKIDGKIWKVKDCKVD